MNPEGTEVLSTFFLKAGNDVIQVSATFDVGRDDGLGSRRTQLGVTLYEDLWVNTLVFVIQLMQTLGA